MKNSGCLSLVALWAVFMIVMGFYDVYEIARLAAQHEIAIEKASHP